MKKTKEEEEEKKNNNNNTAYKTKHEKISNNTAQLDVVARSGCNCCRRASIRRNGSLIIIDSQHGVDVISRWP
jgi:hypothetical protein